MTKIAYDAAYPNPHGIPGTSVVLIYCGGDTPHVWTAAEIAEQPEQYRLPVYVRSNPGNAAEDAAAFIAWLRANGVPDGCATVLDLETRIDVAYVNAFGAALHAAGYLVLPYGSSSTLFQNPALDGYFVASPGATGIRPGCVATQYAYDGSYDLDYIADSVVLWNKAPAPDPAPGDPVDTGTTHSAELTGYGIPGNPGVAVIGQMVNGTGLARTRNVSGGRPLYAILNDPTGYRCVAGFNPKTLPSGTSLAVLITDLGNVTTVLVTEQL